MVSDLSELPVRISTNAKHSGTSLIKHKTFEDTTRPSTFTMENVQFNNFCTHKTFMNCSSQVASNIYN